MIVLTQQEVQDILKIKSRETILKMRESGELKMIKVGGRWKMLSTQLDKYLKQMSSTRHKKDLTDKMANSTERGK